ncbi:MAG: esterase family protein [Alistipes sp.]|nr:esterase family protein [Alistipes sp.]
MKRFSLLIVLVVAVAGSAMAGGKVLVKSLKSSILGVEKSYSIYLPEDYDMGDERYPVLYLLHGAKGTHNSWVRGEQPRITDEEIAAGRAKKMIVVMPDARGIGEKNAGKNMGYFNVPDWPYEDFFFQEFIPHIDQEYRTIAAKEGRAIAGLSMGGGGSIVYAQRHPEMFAAAYSTSGLLDHRYRLSVPSNYDIGWLWSVAQTSPVEYLRHATNEQIEKLRTVRWMMDCGDDDRIISTNIDFYLEMKREKVPVELRIRDGKHNWAFWKEALPLILAFSF